MRSSNVNYTLKSGIIIVMVLFSLLLIPSGLFNTGRYVPIFESPISIISYISFSFYFTVIIEFAIIYCFLRSDDLVKKDLFKSGALVNLSTVPPTQIIGYFFLAFFYQFFPIYGIFVVVVMGFIEWILYRLEFQKLVGKKSLNKIISSKKVLLISVITNFGSGFIMYIYPSIMILLYS